MVPVNVTNSLVGLACPGALAGKVGVTDTMVTGVTVGGVTDPGTVVGTATTEAAAAGAAETLGAGVATAGAVESETSLVFAIGGDFAAGTSAVGISVTGVAATEASFAGAKLVAVVRIADLASDDWRAACWFISFIFCCNASSAAA